MDTTPNKYITVAYELYTDFDGKRELVEKAPIEHPFQFISDMGTTLDAFEAQIKPLQKGEKFNFTLSVEEAYGEYEQERVLELNKDVFKVNGHFDKEHIYPGSVVPLMNADGARFNGTITDVKEDTVTVDLNHPLAGKALNFIGEVTENREAKEVADAVAIVAAGVAETTATATATTMKRVADADTVIKSGIYIFYIERVRHEQYIW